MSVHEAPFGATREWFTPPEVFDRLGLRFDLDGTQARAPFGSVLMAYQKDCANALWDGDFGWTTTGYDAELAQAFAAVRSGAVA